MCIYYLISFTKSIYFLLNFQIPFMFWIIILPLNILYYPTNESIRLVWGAVLGISAVSATFSRLFSGCFGDFCCFSYFLPAFLRLLGWVWGAVLGISAVSATFCRFFSGFLAEFGLFLLHLVGTKSELPLLAFWPAHLL